MTAIEADNSLNYQVNIEAGSFSILSDEPEGIGGDNLGPSPFQLLLASLAACTAMTVRMYARRKDWPEPGPRGASPPRSPSRISPPSARPEGSARPGRESPW